jgi:2-keto-4-pentenoate hydratase/2-oxohepta-3-ene-1,7-dioic acid hydratase in catechol pathway
MNTLRYRDSSKELRAGKILCIGRNFAEHAREMKAEVTETPVVFLKPSSSLIHSGDDVVPPPFSNELHHEVEMVVVIGKKGKNIPRESARAYVEGYCVGLDMTLRDIQADAKKRGLPWTIAKGFDTSAPISSIAHHSKIADCQNLQLSLVVNGQQRQCSNTSKMIFPVDYLISYLSSVFTLEEGDLIFTGTPDGVGPVSQGDVLEAELESVGKLIVGVKSSTQVAQVI